MVWCFAGPHDSAEETFRPIRNSLKPTLDLVGPIPHPALLSMFDPLYPPGMQWYWKADFVNELSDDAIGVHMRYAADSDHVIHCAPVSGQWSREPGG